MRAANIPSRSSLLKCGLLSLAVLIPFATFSTQHPVHELMQELEWDFSTFSNVPQDQTDHFFGHAVAMHGDLLAVGSPGTVTTNNAAERTRGAVSVYRNRRGNWELLQEIAFGAGGDGLCGSAVAISSHILMVGCPFHTGGGLGARGRVLLYRWDASAGQFQNPGAEVFLGENANDRCGNSVAIVEHNESSFTSFAAFSCPGANGVFGEGPIGTPFHGLVEVKRALPLVTPGGDVGYMWFDEHTFRLGFSGPTQDWNYGRGLHLYQHRTGSVYTIIGAPNAHSNNRGLVQVFRRESEGNWPIEQFFEGQSDSRFGFSVHMRGDVLMVGAPRLRRTHPQDPTHQPLPLVGGFAAFRRSSGGSWDEGPTVRGRLACALQQQGCPELELHGQLGHSVHVLQGRISPLPHRWGQVRYLAGNPMSYLWPLDHRSRAQHYIRPAQESFFDQPEFITGDHFRRYGDSPGFGQSVTSNGSGWVAIGHPSHDSGRGRVYIYAYSNDLFSDRFEQ